MAKTRKQKETIVSELKDKIEANKSFFVVAPEAVDPNEAADIKIKLHEMGGEYHIVKNSLFKLALEALDMEVPESFETGQNAVVFAGENAPEAAKVIKEFIKETKKAQFKDGFIDGKQITASQVDEIAELPSREQLIAQVIGTMNAPISGFVNVLAGNIRGIVTVVDAIRAQKAEA